MEIFTLSLSSHVLYTQQVNELNEHLVKVHRVFSSHSGLTVSSRLLQFRWLISQDSEGVVTPLMHDRNYRTRNYATLARSRLPRPFARHSVKGYYPLLPGSSTWQASAHIRHLSILRRLVLLLDSRTLLFSVALILWIPWNAIRREHLLLRTYEVILQSSLRNFQSYP